MELRETIEALRTRNEEAQAVIHGALNTPENMKGWAITGWPFSYLSLAPFHIGCSRLPDLRIQRQNSCESISSLNSLTSMSSMGSMKDQDAKKKKKKSWVRI